MFDLISVRLLLRILWGDEAAVQKKIVRYVAKLRTDYDIASIKSDEIRNAIGMAKNSRAMVIRDGHRNHPELE